MEPQTRQALKDVNLTLRPGRGHCLGGRKWLWQNDLNQTDLSFVRIRPLARLPWMGSICASLILPLSAAKSASFSRDFAKYHFTAQENIWLGNIDVPPDDKAIMASACRSGADDVITDLPQGYETVLGKLFDQGEEPEHWSVAESRASPGIPA